MQHAAFFCTQKSLIWHHAFVHLKHSNDDPATKSLEFDFGPHGGLQVRERGLPMRVTCCHHRLANKLPWASFPSSPLAIWCVTAAASGKSQHGRLRADQLHFVPCAHARKRPHRWHFTGLIARANHARPGCCRSGFSWLCRAISSFSWVNACCFFKGRGERQWSALKSIF